MGWLSDLINRAKKKTEETVQGAVQQGQQVVQNAVAQGQQMAQNAVQQGQAYVQNAVQTGQQAVQNAVQNASQAVADKVNGVNNQIQGTPQVTQPTVSAPVTVPTTTPTTEPTVTPETQPEITPAQTTPSTTPASTPTNTQTSTTEQNVSANVNEPILTYEDYLKEEEAGLGYIKDTVTQQIDKQNQETLKHIDETLESGNKYAEDVKNTTDAAIEEQKQADIAYAESQRDLMLNTSQAERDEVYKYAEETLAGALGYNNEAYGKLVEAITGQMEAGKLAASEAKNLLMIMAEEVKNTTYGAAERQREEAERQADINRQRAIADANSAYEQNKASYGAKAEALGDMGLTAGGYGDWLNASAYAQQRGEVQGARARSDAAKREAKYTEDMTKLRADQDYSDKKYRAESDYQDKLYDIDTSYRANLSEAEQSKLAADKAAQDAERETKQSADSKHRENVYDAESTYGEWLNRAETAEREGKLQNDITYKEMLYGNEQTAKDQKLEASQKAENAKLNAEISYVEGILGNSKALAEYKETLKAGDAAAEEKKLAVYEQLLKGVNDGTYTAEDAAALADAFGLGTEWKDAIANSAGNKAEADANAKAEADSEQKTSIYTGMLDSVNRGAYTAEQISYLADRYGLSAEDKQSLIAAAEKYASDNATQGAEAKATQATKSFVGLLESANAGQLTAEELQQIATEFGLSDAQKDLLTKAAERYIGKVTEAETQADAEYKNGVYTELLNAANAGGYTAEQVKDLAARFGLGETEQNQLVKAADGYSTRVNDEKAQIEAETKLNVYTSLLDAANMGGYTEEQIANLATRYGLDEAQTAELRAAAKEYSDKYSDAVAKDEAAQKNMNFINLLGSANLGELTKDELANVATALGLDDGQKELLAKAAERYTDASDEAKAAQKSMNFVSLLDGANTGAYNAEQIEAIAKEFGFDATKDKALLNMLKTAANDFAAGEAGKTAKEDMQYQNAIYSELLAAANNGDYTEEQAKDLAKRFGLDSKAQNLIGESARLTSEKKEMEENDLIKGESAQNKLAIKGYVTGDTTNEELDEYVSDDLLTQEDADSLKEYRNKQAKTEISNMIKGGNYQGAAARAEELFEMGHIDNDTYQNAYFEVEKQNATNVKTLDDVKDYEAELANAVRADRISAADRENLLKYMYENMVNKLNDNSYKVTTEEKDTILGQAKYTTVKIGDIEVTFDGVSNTLSPAKYDTVAPILDKAAPQGGIVMFDGELYIKHENRWFKANSTYLKNEYQKLYARQPKPNDPKHQGEITVTNGATQTSTANSQRKDKTSTSLR